MEDNCVCYCISLFTCHKCTNEHIIYFILCYIILASSTSYHAFLFLALNHSLLAMFGRKWLGCGLCDTSDQLVCFLLCANVQTEIYKYMAWCLVLCAYHDIRTILRSEIWAFDNIHILSYSEPYMNRLCARGHAHPHIRTSFVFFAFINIHDSCVCVCLFVGTFTQKYAYSWLQDTENVIYL